MIFRQLFDESSWTYTYLIADAQSHKAALIDPVLEKVDLYVQLLNELGLELTYAIDTHVHADHITGLGRLRQLTNCEAVHGKQSKATGISKFVDDGEILTVGQLALEVIYTPGHTDDSYCFLLANTQQKMLFSGDTLLIRGTGRTDFQHGCSKDQYHSLFNKLLCLEDSTLVYPGHDYRGLTVSTIGEEKRHNPRLQVRDFTEYHAIMSNLNLAPPKKIEIAVPANLVCGLL